MIALRGGAGSHCDLYFIDRNLSFSGDKEPPSLHWACHLVWEHLPISYCLGFFVLLRCVYRKAPGEPHCSICLLWGGDRHCALAQGVCAGRLLLSTAWRDPWPWGTDAHCWGLSCLSLLYVSKAFSPSGVWLLCVFLATLIWRCSGKKNLDLYSWWQATWHACWTIGMPIKWVDVECKASGPSHRFLPSSVKVSYVGLND